LERKILLRVFVALFCFFIVTLVAVCWVISRLDLNFDGAHSYNVQKIRKGNLIYSNEFTIDRHCHFSHTISVEREFWPGCTWPVFSETYYGFDINIAEDKIDPEVLTMYTSHAGKSYSSKIRIRDGKLISKPSANR
jgi:hypothetical protein